MLVLAALIYAGTWSTTTARTHATLPASGGGSAIGTRVIVQRTLPPPLKGNVLQDHMRRQDVSKQGDLRCHPSVWRMDGPANSARCLPSPYNP